MASANLWVRMPRYPLRVNNGDAMMPALIAGTGLGILPEFFLREALESKQLERLLPDWSIPLGAVYWVTPPEGQLPKRVEVLRDYLIETLARAAVAEDHGVHHSSRDAPGGSSRRGPDPSSER
jgi:DNA-binding transcriptional LysR family regulator